jgi:antitoxin component YwqK of YwqJK toxin-antitoxin module
MKKLLLTLLFSTSLSTYALDLEFSSDTFCTESPKAQLRSGLYYQPNQQEPFTGQNLCVYSNGQYHSKGKVKDGKRNGKWTYWYENGHTKFERTYNKNQIERERNYQNGAIVNDTKYSYYENGLIKEEEYYKDGKLDSSSLHQYNQNDQKELVEHYKDGNLVSETKYSYGYWKDRWCETNYKDGKENGKENCWHKNGQKWIETNYKDGKQDGMRTVWYDNGNIVVWQVIFKDGKKDGIWTSWRENGQIWSEEIYKDGVCISGDCD